MKLNENEKKLLEEVKKFSENKVKKKGRRNRYSC